MTTVNVRKKAAAATETPSESLVKKAAAEVTIETPNGFSVTLKRPGVLSSFRLVKMLGDAARTDAGLSLRRACRIIMHDFANSICAGLRLDSAEPARICIERCR